MKANRMYWRYTLTVLCVFAIGVAVRLLPLYWTPYPFNPDGFVFAAAARDSLTLGYIPRPDEHRLLQLHQYVFVALLVILSQITDLEPIWIAQPTIAIIGTIPALLALLLVRKLGIELGWPADRTFIAATLAGFVLAVEGLYLRRTVTVSYEVLGLLFVAAVALCVHRFFESSRRSWLGVAGVMLLALPATHHFSTVITAVTLTVLVATWIDRRPTRITFGAGAVVVIGFWTYLLSYYARSPPNYSDTIMTNPALFVAWIIAIVALAHWFQTAKPASSRGTIACVNVIGFGVLALNAIKPVFPGMSSTPTLLLALVAPLTVLAVLTIWGLPIVVRLSQGPLVLALLVAPLAFIGLSLTAGLSPQYISLAQRTQTFVHFGTVVITVLAAFVLHDRVQDRSQTFVTAVKIGLPITLILVAVVTIPIAFVGLEALSYQGTTTEAEFSAATFASTTMAEPWTGDDHITRVEGNYYGSEHNRGPSPVYDWLHGGDPPACSVVAEDSWTTVGAQLYPAPPEQISEEVYNNWQAENNLVYVSGNDDEQLVIVTPPSEPPEEC